jgi:hypothetical protein
MHSLEQMFPSLTLFSDLNWDVVTKEYESEYIDISFPEYLQQKALDGDCPPYLFELAFYELALFDAKTSDEPFPYKSGIYLNPTALFLSLEYDIKRMLTEAQAGQIEVYERNHVLCLFRDSHDVIQTMDMSEEELDLLQHLEDGPQDSKNFINSLQEGMFRKLVRSGLILDLISA